MPQLPLALNVSFVATTLLTLWLFWRAAPRTRVLLPVLAGWLVLQAAIAASGFYLNTTANPPRIVLQVLPSFATIAVLFATARGRRWLDQFSAERLTLLHTIRIPVELVLFGLFVAKAIPEIMTFEGRNFDILAGLTAPLMVVFGYRRKQLGKRILLVWNLICVGLLLNIVIHAALSTPYSFQQFGSEQPNVAILEFPYCWLPSCVVPLVLIAHLITIRQLLRSPSNGMV